MFWPLKFSKKGQWTQNAWQWSQLYISQTVVVNIWVCVCVWLSFVKNSSFCGARTTWNDLWCSRRGQRKWVFSRRLIAVVGQVARTFECWSRLCSIRDGQNVGTARGWTRQESMLSPSHCVSKSVTTPFQLFHFFLVSFIPPFWSRLIACYCGSGYTWTCVPWVCRLWTLDKIFFWWPARLTPILANSLQGRRGITQFRSCCLWNLLILFHRNRRLAAPDADVEDWVQADISRSGKVFFILAHLDGVKPLVHRVHSELGGGRLFPTGMQSTFTFYLQCSSGVLFWKRQSISALSNSCKICAKDGV